MAKNEFGIGKPVRRKEDRRLLTGRGRYTVDIDIPGQAHAVLLRSPHAHARIASIDSRMRARAAGRFGHLRRRRRTRGKNEAGADRPGGLWSASCADEFPRRRAVESRRLGYATPRHSYRWRPTVRASSAMPSRWSSPRRWPRHMTPPKRSKSITRSCPQRLMPRTRRGQDAPLLWDQPSNVCLDAEAGNASDDRSGLCARGAYRAAQDLVPARYRRHRWSRVPPSPITTPRVIMSRSMPPPAPVRSAPKPASIWCSAGRRIGCASSPMISAAISARVTPSIQNRRCSPGQRTSSNARSNGSRIARKASLPISKAAISSPIPS